VWAGNRGSKFIDRMAAMPALYPNVLGKSSAFLDDVPVPTTDNAYAGSCIMGYGLH
jgi:hypothetical protein